MSDVVDTVNKLSLKELGGEHPIFRLATFTIYLISLILIFNEHPFSTPVWLSLSEKSIKSLLLSDTGIVYTVTPCAAILALFLVFVNRELYHHLTMWRSHFFIKKFHIPEKIISESDKKQESLKKSHDREEIAMSAKIARSAARRHEKAMTRSMELSQMILALLVVSVVSLFGVLARKVLTWKFSDFGLVFYDLAAPIIWLLFFLYIEWQRLTKIVVAWANALTERALTERRLKELGN